MRRSLSHLLLMLALTATTFAVGASLKAPCASQSGPTPTSRTAICYTDLGPLLGSEQLQDGRLPYVQACESGDLPCDEYPLGSMYVLRAFAGFVREATDPPLAFFWMNAALLLSSALAITWSLDRMGARTLLFAVAPVLAVNGATNLDLLPVALMCLAMLAFVRGRHVATGILIGLGAVVKLFPGVLLIPFGWSRSREGPASTAGQLVGAGVGTFLLFNLPFAILYRDGWMKFFRLSSERPADYDSLWALPSVVGLEIPAAAINVLSPALLIVGVTVVWRVARKREPELETWMLAFPLLTVLLLTGKVWSPQYGLWLLPWFALTRVPVRAFLQYQVAEVAEVSVRYSFYSTLGNGGGAPFELLAFVVVVRALLLLRCLALWTRDPSPPDQLERDAPRGTSSVVDQER